jgi:SAM-dependent methyltransferase
MMPDDYRREHAVSFARAAQAYERGRPPYPAAAIDWLLPDGARRVLDLGAGTGKLTRLLAARGLAVTAVEPLAEMRDQLRRAVPDVPALAGTAEQIPLPDASVEAVLVAQAWHWVDVPAAVPEVARVLTSGGRLGLLWNVRDEREDWVAKLGEITRRREGPHASSRRISQSPAVGPPFGPVERRDVTWVHHLTPAELTDMIASRSYVITLPADQRAEMFAEVDDLLRAHPALAGAAEIALPYVTRCSRARLGR